MINSLLSMKTSKSLVTFKIKNLNLNLTKIKEVIKRFTLFKYFLGIQK